MRARQDVRDIEWQVSELSDVITTLASLIIGVITGYYFERRSTQATREQNRELQDRLRALRESIYSLGGSTDTDHHGGTAPPGDLQDEVLRWMREYQGPDGTISRMRVIRRFIDSGYPADEITAAMVRLDEQGAIILDESIEVR